MRERGVSTRVGLGIIAGFLLTVVVLGLLVEYAGFPGSGAAVLGLLAYFGIHAAYAALGGREPLPEDDQDDRSGLVNSIVHRCGPLILRVIGWVVLLGALAFVAFTVYLIYVLKNSSWAAP